MIDKESKTNGQYLTRKGSRDSSMMDIDYRSGLCRQKEIKQVYMCCSTLIVGAVAKSFPVAVN